MKKLKLDLDRLVVEGFEAEPARVDREGTVQAHQSGLWTCYPCTDWQSCGGSCEASCWC
jgi:hypothetical protein